MRKRLACNLANLIILLFLLLPKFSAAQNFMRLQDLMQQAVRHNADVLIQKGDQHIVNLRRKQSIASMLPQLNLEGSYLHSSARQGTPSFAGANGAKERIVFLSLHQKLFDAEALTHISDSGIENEIQKIVSEQLKQKIIEQVIESYFTALKLKGEIEILKETINAFQILYEQSKLLYETGVVPEIDVKKSLVEYLLQKNTLQESKKNYQAVLNYIKEIIGMPISTPIKIGDFAYQTVHLDSLQTYQKAALTNRPELKVLQLEQKRTLLEKRLTLLRQLPAVDAGLFYGWDSIDLLQKDNLGWQAFIHIQFPLWHWGAQQAEYQIATIRYRQSKQVMLKFEKQIRQEVINNYNEAIVQQQQISTMEESKKESAEALRMAQIGYREGTITNLEVINAQKLFTRSQIQYLDALYNFYLAKGKLYRSIGQLKEDLSWLE